jgi:hypothetical protein
LLQNWGSTEEPTPAARAKDRLEVETDSSLVLPPNTAYQWKQEVVYVNDSLCVVSSFPIVDLFRGGGGE